MSVLSRLVSRIQALADEELDGGEASVSSRSFDDKTYITVVVEHD